MDARRLNGTVSPAATRRNRAFRNGIAVTGTVLILSIWITVFLVIHYARDAAIREAGRNAANLTLAFSEQVSRSLAAIEEAMNFLEADILREGASFKLVEWAQRERTVAGFNLQLSIVGPDGRLKATMSDPNPPPVDYSDQEFFRVHLSGNSGTIFIGKPAIDPLSHLWSIHITRRMDKPDGSFAGVIVFPIDPDYLIRLYEPADLGNAGVVTLDGLDGIVRARVGRTAEVQHTTLGASVAGNPLFRRMIITDSGTMRTRSRLDNIERIFSYRRIQGYPLIIVIGLGLDEVLAGPNATAFHMIMITVAVTLLLALMTAYLVIEMNRRGLREEELAGERTKLEMINRQLEISRNEAEVANRAKSEFLANMSHELRTPLNAVIGFAEVMRDELIGPLGNPTYREYTQHIHENGHKLLEAINNILDLSKIESGRMKLKEDTVDISKLVESRVRAFKAQADAARVTLSVDLSNAPSEIRGDEARLNQMLENLLSNAVKFTPTGGRVMVRAYRASDGGLTLLVEDTGIGIAPENIRGALEPFSQVDSKLSRKFGGTGLGLSLVKRLVELHGGTLRIDSAPGEGTTVSVSLPKERVESGASA